MQAFRDGAGRTWTVEINVTAIRRLRAVNAIDVIELVALVDDRADPFPGIRRLSNDPILAADLLWSLVESQAAAAGITMEQFGLGLAGEALAGAVHALILALAEFCPEASKREALKKMVAYGIRAQELAAAKVAAIDPEAEAAAAAAPSRGPGSNGISTASPGSSASIPAPSLGVVSNG
jgi:hypothetical protein